MKPWGSQATFLVFQTFFRPSTPAPQAEGWKGEKMSPPFFTLTPAAFTSLRVRLRVALDYSSCGTSSPRAACRPTNLDTPRRPFVRPSLGDTGLSLADRPSCELTRLAPLGVPFS